MEEGKIEMMVKWTPKAIFKKPELLTASYKKYFFLERVHVEFDLKKLNMKVTLFSMQGKAETNEYPFPFTQEQLLRSIIKTTGKSVIEYQMNSLWRKVLPNY